LRTARAAAPYSSPHPFTHADHDAASAATWRWSASIFFAQVRCGYDDWISSTSAALCGESSSSRSVFSDQSGARSRKRTIAGIGARVRTSVHSARTSPRMWLAAPARTSASVGVDAPFFCASCTTFKPSST
jgi:hypothetical protein